MHGFHLCCMYIVDPWGFVVTTINYQYHNRDGIYMTIQNDDYNLHALINISCKSCCVIMIHNYNKFCFISSAQVYVNLCTELYMFFTAWETRTGKIFCRGLKDGSEAEGLGTFLRPGQNIVPVRTDLNGK